MSVQGNYNYSTTSSMNSYAANRLRPDEDAVVKNIKVALENFPTRLISTPVPEFDRACTKVLTSAASIQDTAKKVGSYCDIYNYFKRAEYRDLASSVMALAVDAAKKEQDEGARDSLLINMYVNTEQFDEAKAFAANLVAKDENSFAQLKLIKALATKGQFDHAISVFDVLNKDFEVGACSDIANAYLSINSFEKAKAWASKLPEKTMTKLTDKIKEAEENHAYLEDRFGAERYGTYT